MVKTWHRWQKPCFVVATISGLNLVEAVLLCPWEATSSRFSGQNALLLVEALCNGSTGNFTAVRNTVMMQYQQKRISKTKIYELLMFCCLA